MASEWIKHVLAVKKARGLSFKNALKEAKKTYKSSGHSMTHKKHHKKHKRNNLMPLESIFLNFFSNYHTIENARP